MALKSTHSSERRRRRRLYLRDAFHSEFPVAVAAPILKPGGNAFSIGYTLTDIYFPYSMMRDERNCPRVLYDPE